MCVLLNVIKINEMLYDYFGYDVYDMFLNGYCLEYYEILKILYPEGKLVIEKESNHCGCMINGDIYDVTGVRNRDSFFIADENDINFIYSFYNKFDDKLKNEIYKQVSGYVKTIKKCLHDY